VSSAFLDARQTPSLLSGANPTTEEVVRLTALLDSDNDLLATQAFRTLLDTGQLRPDITQKVLSTAHDYQLAVFTYLLLSAGPSSDKLRDKLFPIAKDARDPATVRMLALGAFAAARLGGSIAISPSKQLLELMRAQLDDRDIPSGRDPYTDLLLDRAGNRN
jgi:hypothetical protein